jgi:hypothetical protein
LASPANDDLDNPILGQKKFRREKIAQLRYSIYFSHHAFTLPIVGITPPLV